MPRPLPRFNGFAIVLHWLIAAGLVGQVALGWWSGDPIRFFGVTLAGWGWKGPSLKALIGGIHYVAVRVLMGLILLHVSAALRHLARRDGAFWRILPRGAS